MIYLEIAGNAINDLLDFVDTTDSEVLEELEILDNSSFHSKEAFFEKLDELNIASDVLDFIKSSYISYTEV